MYLLAVVPLYYTLDDSIRYPLKLWLFLFWTPLTTFHIQFWTFIAAFRKYAQQFQTAFQFLVNDFVVTVAPLYYEMVFLEE
jgi:hypothetical protein